MRGEVFLPRANQASMDFRLYVLPSAAITGAVITSMEMGQQRASGWTAASESTGVVEAGADARALAAALRFGAGAGAAASRWTGSAALVLEGANAGSGAGAGAGAGGGAGAGAGGGAAATADVCGFGRRRRRGRPAVDSGSGRRPDDDAPRGLRSDSSRKSSRATSSAKENRSELLCHFAGQGKAIRALVPLRRPRKSDPLGGPLLSFSRIRS